QGTHLARAAGTAHPDLGAQLADELRCRGGPDVGSNEGVLDLLPALVVESVPGEQAEQHRAEPALRAREPPAQPGHPAGHRLRGSGWGGSTTSAGGPVTVGISRSGWPAPSPSPGLGGACGGAAGGASGAPARPGRRRERTSMAPPAIRTRTTRTMAMIRYSIT